MRTTDDGSVAVEDEEDGCKLAAGVAAATVLLAVDGAASGLLAGRFSGLVVRGKTLLEMVRLSRAASCC